MNGLLPEIMSESCIVNNEVHDQSTRQSHLLHTIKESNHISIQSNIGPRIWNSIQNKVNVSVSFAQFKRTSKLFFQESMLEFHYQK